ncbi:MAG: AAA family ATPase [Candidatus Omnitrophota bacterium]
MYDKDMYRNFFNLKEKPFSVTSDPSFFFLSKKHKEAYSHLLYGVKERKGIIKITGEVGAGKTTLCKRFLSEANSNIKTAFILNPAFSEVQLLQLVLRDFGLDCRKASKFELISELNKFLIDQARSGGNAVLIIDEAQNLRLSQLEHIRLLSNLETEKEKLFQIILVGQPELNDKLNSPKLIQLKQRVSVSFHIPPLDKEEVKEYVHHRLNIAGEANNIQFDDFSFDAIYNYSLGIPRLVNLICDRALLAAFTLNTLNINNKIVENCIKELN